VLIVTQAQKGGVEQGAVGILRFGSGLAALDSLFSRKVPLFGHFEGWSVDTLTAAVSKLQTSASAGEDFELAP
jgi:hypothetical protein